MVAAGAVVTHNVEPWTLVAGVPARPIGKVNEKGEVTSKNENQIAIEEKKLL